MSVYLDRLRAEFSDITGNIDSILERAADANRDLTDDENAQIEREDARRTQLQASIDSQVALLERTNRVTERLSGLRMPGPNQIRTVDEAPQFDLAREFPTAGHYAATVHRALVQRDRSAIDLLERATAHQTTADNPGLIPRPIVGPVVDRMRNTRPFIVSVGVQDAPAQKFDRPNVTQHVDVNVQTNEKDLTASQKMVVDPVPVTLATYAGHLNLSRQDIRWSQPSILNLAYESFSKVYARRTDKAACAAFVSGITATGDIETVDPAGIDAALGAAGSTVETADGDMGELNRIWMSRDVAVQLGSLRNTVTGAKVFNIPIVGGTSGDLDGIPVTIDPRFAPGTLIAGDESLVEYWEDLEGFLTVDEPDVLGQMIGYAGYGSLCIVDKAGFVKLSLPAAP